MNYTELISKADSRLNKKHLSICLNHMLSRLSIEGQEILINWLKQSKDGGWNRWNKLFDLASFYGLDKFSKTRPHYLTKSDLISYTNKDLLKLVNGIDLIELGKNKFYVVKE